MGQSAGSMNLAKTVYNYPEEASEINDPKFLTGLGLTNVSVIPHFNIETGNDQVDDDIDFMNDYLKKDSFILPLYCITNASHIKIEGDLVESYGEVYMVKNGIITQLENAGQIIIDENE